MKKRSVSSIAVVDITLLSPITNKGLMSTTAMELTDRFFIDQEAASRFDTVVCQSLLNDQETTDTGNLFLRQP